MALSARRSRGRAVAPPMPPQQSDSMEIDLSPPDKFTALPAEILLRIIAFLHKPGDGCWTDKSDLKALHLLYHPILGPLIKEELFRCITLTFTYDFDRERMDWTVPRLVRLIEQEEAFLDLVGKYTTALRLVILPIPKSVFFGPFDDLHHYVFNREVLWSQHIETRLSENCSPCTSLLHPPAHPYERRSGTFPEVFGELSDGEGEAAREDIWTDIQRTTKTSRKVFSSYVFIALHKLLPKLSKLKHLEPGIWPYLPRLYDAGYRIIANFGLAFAEAIILARVPPTISSFRMPTLTLYTSGQMLLPTHPTSATGVGFVYRIDQLNHYAQQLQVFDLDFACFDHFAGRWSGWTEWGSIDAYFVDLIKSMTGVKRLGLRLSTGWDRAADAQKTWLTEILLEDVELQRPESLELGGWNVSPDTLGMIAPRFAGLKKLRLDELTMMGGEEDAWLTAIDGLMEAYGRKIQVDAHRLKQKGT